MSNEKFYAVEWILQYQKQVTSGWVTGQRGPRDHSQTSQDNTKVIGYCLQPSGKTLLLRTELAYAIEQEELENNVYDLCMTWQLYFSVHMALR